MFQIQVDRNPISHLFYDPLVVGTCPVTTTRWSWTTVAVNRAPAWYRKRQFSVALSSVTKTGAQCTAEGF